MTDSSRATAPATTPQSDTSAPTTDASAHDATPTPPTDAPTSGSAAPGDKDEALVTTQGRTTIADTVVAKIAGIAAREVSGVHALGGGAARAVDALRERIPGGGANHSQGVSVEVGERQAAVDIELTSEYGVAIADLASSVRRNVIDSIERMTGLEVSEVNITVQDVFLESDEHHDDDGQAEGAVKEPRVQ